MATELVLVRHAEPARDVPEGERGDPALGELGRRQARLVADHLAPESFDALWSSPMARTLQTAEPLADVTGLKVQVHQGLAEFDRGAVAYARFEDMRDGQTDLYAAYLAGDLSPWGTDADTFRATIDGAVRDIVDAHAGQRVLIVTHGGVVNALLGGAIAVPRLFFHEPAYTGVSRLLVGRSGKRLVVTLNEHTHLRALSVN